MKLLEDTSSCVPCFKKAGLSCWPLSCLMFDQGNLKGRRMDYVTMVLLYRILRLHEGHQQVSWPLDLPGQARDLRLEEGDKDNTQKSKASIIWFPD